MSEQEKNEVEKGEALAEVNETEVNGIKIAEDVR